MSNEENYFYLRNEQNKITYDRLQQLGQKAFAQNSRLMQIFRFFDKDGNGQLDETNETGTNELSALWEAATSGARANSGSIFSTPEAQSFLRTAGMDNQGITSEDLLEFMTIATTPDVQGTCAQPPMQSEVSAQSPTANDASTPEAKLALLSQIKNSDGSQKYSNEDIAHFISINPNVPTTVLYALLSAKTDDYYDNKKIISDILSNLKDPQELRIIEILTEADKYTIENNSITNQPLKNNFSLTNIMVLYTDRLNTRNSEEPFQKENYTLILEKVINSGISEALSSFSKEEAIEKIISSIKTEDQLKIFEIIANKLNNVPTESSFFNSITPESIASALENVISQEDIEVFQKLLAKAKELSDINSVCGYYSDIAATKENPDKNALMKQTLAALAENPNHRLYQISGVLNELKYNNFENFDSELFLSILEETKNDNTLIPDNKENPLIEKLKFAAALNKTMPLYEYFKQTGDVPKDSYELNMLTPTTNEQKEALLFLLRKRYEDTQNNQQPARFNYYELSKILIQIKTPKDFESLQTILENEGSYRLNAFEILKALSNDGEVVIKPQPTQEDIERHQAETAELCKKFPNLPENYPAFLSSLKITDPERFDRLINSGFLELVNAGQINADLLTEERFGVLSNRTITEIEQLSANTPLVTTLPPETDISRLSEHVENGGVFEHNGQLFINIDGKATEIKMTKEMFEKLFPRLTSTAFGQGKLGDCYFVSAIDACLDEPKGRAILYSLFEQKGNDIYVKFPRMDKSICFKNGNPNNVGEKGIRGKALGVQILEQAYAVHRLEFNGNRAYQSAEVTNLSELTDIQTLMARLEGGISIEVINDFWRSTQPETNQQVPNRLQPQEAFNQITTNANTPDCLVLAGTAPFPFAHPKLIHSHAYTIKGYDKNTGIVYLTNPHYAGNVIKMPIYELILYLNHVESVDLSNRN